MEQTRILAIDWSGALHGAERHIWLAEADDAGRLVRLEAGRDRKAMLEHLLDEFDRTPHSVVGFDFAFSFPAWFIRQLGLADVREVWARVARDGEAWLATCEPPFWGRHGRRRPELGGPAFRQLEFSLQSRGKSVFQIGGSGSVGTGSIRGMPVLAEISRAGASIWPFDPPGWPRAVEIYPRLLTGPVVKSNPVARAAYLDRQTPGLDPIHRRLAVESEDAFDAAISALVMAAHTTELASLEINTDPVVQLEGQIWQPALAPQT
jgi:hypothetical protein